MKSKILAVVSNNIKRYRNKKGISGMELSERAGISYEYLRRIEAPNMKCGMSINTLIKLAYALELPVVALVKSEGGDDND